MFFTTLLIFLLVLSILVLVHEFGHFLAARFFRVRVEEFALGLPFTRPIISKKGKDKMLWSVYPVLFGGFVRLLGEEGDDQRNNPKSFAHKKPSERALILLSGVSMNIILGIVLLYIMLSISSFKTFVPSFARYNFHNATQVERVIVTEVKSGTPADLAGIRSGDILVSVGSLEITGTKSTQDMTRKYAGESVEITLYHQVPLSPKKVYVIPRKSPPSGEGPLGIAIADVLEISYPTLSQRLTSGLALTYDLGIYTIKVLATLINDAIAEKTAAPVVSNLSGPVGIFNVTKSFLTVGGVEALFNIIQLMALMTINLAIFNVLPFPALDGGRLFFVMIEGITGKRVNAKWERYIHQTGMAILLALMLLVTFNDLVRIFTK